MTKILTVILQFTETDDGLGMAVGISPDDISGFRAETIAVVTQIYKGVNNAMAQPPDPPVQFPSQRRVGAPAP